MSDVHEPGFLLGPPVAKGLPEIDTTLPHDFPTGGSIKPEEFQDGTNAGPSGWKPNYDAVEPPGPMPILRELDHAIHVRPSQTPSLGGKIANAPGE